MNILILGASQGTGALAVKEALARGHEVTAFARTPQKLAVDHPKLKKLTGDFHDRASVEGAVVGHDAVIITASATSLRAFKENPQYFSRGTGFTIGAMKLAGIKRIIVLSALGVGESRPLVNVLVRLIGVDFLLKNAFLDHDVQEKQVRDSGLDWVVARPGRLTDGAARRRYVKTTALEPVPSSISRADVADFLVDACEVPTWVGKAVQLGG